MLASSTAFTDFAFVVLGGALAGVIGILTSGYTQRKNGRSQMISEVGMIMTLPKDGKLHAKGLGMIQTAIWKARPFLSKKGFAECLEILEELRKVDRDELTESKEVSFTWSRMNAGQTVDDRLRGFVERFSEAVKR